MNNRETMTDEALIEAFAGGDSDSFDIIVERYKDGLVRYIYNIVGVKDDTDDIIQETFMRLIIMIKDKRYNESGRLSNLLFTMARNLAFDYLKKGKEEAITTDDGSIDAVANSTKYAELSTEAVIIANQTNIDLRNLIEKLPESQRKVVEMRIFEERSFREIAQLTGVSVNTALGRMHYALVNLRKMIDDNNFDFES